MNRVRVACCCVSLLLSLVPLGAAVAQNNGSIATTVQLPTFGVAIDAEGVLSLKTFEDPTGRLRTERAAAARAKLPADVQATVPLRKVSLTRLEQAIAARHAEGKPLDDAMLRMAGLRRVQYIFCFPETRELMLAGPAEGWWTDPAGRAIGLSSGLPVLDVRDLAVALRTFPPHRRDRVFVGCTVDPDPAALVRLRDFQKTIPSTISARQRDEVASYMNKGQRDALGMANAKVFGVPANTRFAQVLLEADCRMKHIAIGLEPPPVRMTTFISALQSPPKNSLQRWWFVPDFDCLRVSADRLALELTGDRVQLLTEEKFISSDGTLLKDAKSSSQAADLYVNAFNAKYSEISLRVPVFAELRTMIDWTIIAAFFRQHDYYERLHWRAEALRDEKILAVENQPTPKKVQCVANAVWKGSRLLAPAGGGVSIHAEQAFAAERLKIDTDGILSGAAQAASTIPANRWWWD